MRSEEILKRAEEGMKESNKILIQELVKDLEEKGIKPVISIGGKVKELKLLAESKLKKFEAELKKFDLKKSEFCLLEEYGNKKKSHNDSIFLIHKKSAKVKKYKVGNKSHWIADFHHDLVQNFFSR